MVATDEPVSVSLFPGAATKAPPWGGQNSRNLSSRHLEAGSLASWCPRGRCLLGPGARVCSGPRSWCVGAMPTLPSSALPGSPSCRDPSRTGGHPMPSDLIFVIPSTPMTLFLNPVKFHGPGLSVSTQIIRDTIQPMIGLGVASPVSSGQHGTTVPAPWAYHARVLCGPCPSPSTQMGLVVCWGDPCGAGAVDLVYAQSGALGGGAGL